MALPELVTRSVLDVVTENFDRVNLKAFACRAVYAGDHTLDREELVDVFRGTVDAVNAQYCDVPLTGFLLAYNSYFVHVLEGSEDTINRQLRFLRRSAADHDAAPPPDADGDPDPDDAAPAPPAPPAAPPTAPPAAPPAAPERSMFRRLKLLIVYHSIEEPTITGWGVVLAKPPTLLTKLDPRGPVALHMEQLSTCLDKIQRLTALYIDNNEVSFEGLSASDPKMEVLPEFVLLELLLDSKYVIELSTYARLHRRVDDHTFYHERVWPPPTHYTPRHLYKLKVDDTFVEPLPQQEWQRRSAERERDDDDATSAASSD